MLKTFRCMNCGLEKPANYRLKAQRYCGDLPCQRARRREYQRNRLARDARYRQNQMACRKGWREKQALAQYQSSYRDSHPEYVERNRQQQRWRNWKRAARRQLCLADKIVKMNACTRVKSGVYLLIPCAIPASPKIVKMNSFMAELFVLQEDSTIVSLGTS